MKWISVKHKVPKNRQRVLIFSHDERHQKIELGFSRNDDDRIKYNENGFNIWNSSNEDYDQVEALYWMKLPNQPERLSEKTSSDQGNE